MKKEVKKIALLTGGGDCSGLNAVIRAIVKSAILKYGYKVVGFKGGYHGLYVDDYIDMNLSSVSGIFHQGGTILKMSNKDNLFHYRTIDENGNVTLKYRVIWEMIGTYHVNGEIDGKPVSYVADGFMEYVTGDSVSPVSQ